MDDLYWLAFLHEEKVFSLILFSQWKAFPPEDWELLFSEVSKRFSETVYISRKPLAAQKTVSVQRFSDKVLKSFIEERSTRNVHLFSIDLSGLIDQLQSSGSGMNRLNMKKEIISVFRTMSGPNQGLLDLDNQKVLFMLDKERIPDRGLFIHQLSSSLPLLFQDLTESPALQTEDFTIPENDDDWQTLTETLLR